MTNPEALTPHEAAERLCCSTVELTHLVDDGEIVGFLLNGKWRVSTDELARYVREKKTDAAGRRTIREAR